MTLTALGSGKFIVSVNGVDVSSHLTEREAMESAMNSDAELVEYRHEYRVQVKKGSKRAFAQLAGGVIVMNEQ